MLRKQRIDPTRITQLSLAKLSAYVLQRVVVNNADTQDASQAS
jgi:hypothetical protein